MQTMIAPVTSEAPQGRKVHHSDLTHRMSGRMPAKQAWGDREWQRNILGLKMRGSDVPR